MNGYDIISSLSSTLTGEEFINTMLISGGDGKYIFTINGNFETSCPDLMESLNCNKNCKECWTNTLRTYGYRFENDIVEKDNCIIVDLFTSISFPQMMTNLKENKNLVYYADKNLYFIKNNILKYCSYIQKDCYGILPYSKDVSLDIDLFSKTFHPTNLFCSDIVSEIRHSEVSKYLELGHALIYFIGERCYNIWKENNKISYYTEDVDPDSEDSMTIFAHDMLSSLYEGQWFIEDEIEY